MAQALNSRMSSTVPRTKTAIGHEDNETDSISAYGTARSTVSGKPLSAEEFRKLSAYFNISLYLCLRVLYLKDNPLLK